jgi:hypothetical protein
LDSDTLGVDSGQVGVFEERDEVSLGSFLESHNGGRLETKIGLEILSDFTNETLEATEFRSQNEFCQLNESSRERDRDSRKLANEKFGRLLVTTNLTKSDGSGTVSVRLLDTSSGGSRLAGSLGSKLLTGSLSSGRFTSGLLGTGHCCCCC